MLVVCLLFCAFNVMSLNVLYVCQRHILWHVSWPMSRRLSHLSCVDNTVKDGHWPLFVKKVRLYFSHNVANQFSPLYVKTYHHITLWNISHPFYATLVLLSRAKIVTDYYVSDLQIQLPTLSGWGNRYVDLCFRHTRMTLEVTEAFLWYLFQCFQNV